MSSQRNPTQLGMGSCDHGPSRVIMGSCDLMGPTREGPTPWCWAPRIRRLSPLRLISSDTHSGLVSAESDSCLVVSPKTNARRSQDKGSGCRPGTHLVIGKGVVEGQTQEGGDEGLVRLPATRPPSTVEMGKTVSTGALKGAASHIRRRWEGMTAGFSCQQARNQAQGSRT